METLSISALWRYPIKGLVGEKLSQAAVLPEKGFDGDRRWMLTTADITQMLAGQQAWRPWQCGHTLKSNPRLACLLASLQDDGALKIAIDSSVVAAQDEAAAQNINQQSICGMPSEESARQKIGKFAADFLQDEKVQLTDCTQHPAWDYPEAHVSVLFEESINCFSQHVGQAVDARRFRANILLAGGAKWNENARGGEMLHFSNGVVLRAIEPITRCLATHVNPDTAVRDMQVPQTLLRSYGHNTMGIKCAVEAGGALLLGEQGHWQQASANAN